MTHWGRGWGHTQVVAKLRSSKSSLVSDWKVGTEGVQHPISTPHPTEVILWRRQGKHWQGTKPFRELRGSTVTQDTSFVKSTGRQCGSEKPGSNLTTEGTQGHTHSAGPIQPSWFSQWALAAAHEVAELVLCCQPLAFVVSDLTRVERAVI